MRQRNILRKSRQAFILLLVLIVVAMASLAALNFSRSMLVTHEGSRISAGRLQARMCAESGAQTARLILAYPRADRLAMGGTWNNPAMFQARNVIPDVDPARRGNFTIVAPSLDEFGNYSGLRFGLQNESAKLNLNMLAQLDALASSGSTDGQPVSLASSMLMALPGMTQDVADAILDWLDEDDEPRALGAEFADYYQQLQPAYKPTNGPIQSIEQLLLVRGITPQMLFGYDENRNGILDDAEMTKMSMGIQTGMPAGSLPPTAMDPSATPPPPLGWAPYLTLQSQEKNVASDGSPRININSDDMQMLYEDLSTVLQNEEWASFIVAYRYGGTPGGNGVSPLVTLAGMAATNGQETDGMLGVQLNALSAANPQGNSGRGGRGGGGGGGGGGQPQPWSADALDSLDLSQAGSVRFNQVLDSIDATVTLQGRGGAAVTYSSPFSSLPLDLALSTPILMDYLTTVDAPAMPGRINIMECPQEILRGIPGLSEEVVGQILEARVDGSESPTRNFETWLVIEGYITMDEMRALLPLITCGGDVFKAQIIGYLEGDAAFSRIEAVINATKDVPLIPFFRRMDHLGRGFDILTLGQRFDAGDSAGLAIP